MTKTSHKPDPISACGASNDTCSLHHLQPHKLNKHCTEMSLDTLAKMARVLSFRILCNEVVHAENGKKIKCYLLIGEIILFQKGGVEVTSFYYSYHWQERANPECLFYHAPTLAKLVTTMALINFCSDP